MYQNEPLTYLNKDGTAEGLYIEILESIALKEGWELQFIQGTLEESLERLDNGSIDILPAIPFTPEMDEQYMLTTEAAFTDWGLVYTYRGSGISSTSDIGGKKIAGQNDLFFDNFNASLGTSNTSYVFVAADNYMDVFELVQSREADAGIIARSYGERHEAQYDVEKISFVISPTDMVFALPKNTDNEIARIIDENIAQMVIEDGNISYVPAQTSNPDLTTWESPSWLKLSVGVGGSLLLLFVILSLTLRNKVDEKTSELNSKNRELEVEIRERKIAEEKLKQYSLELKNSNELKDLFTDILRHDLINPATVIKGYVEYLIELENEDKRKDALKAIERNNKKLIDLIENAANLAKLENMDELDFEAMDLKEIIKEIIDNLKPKLDGKAMNITFEPTGEYPADVNTTIEDVFSNLIGNSIKYSPAGSTITINIDDLDDEWEVSITDEGEGIPDKDKPHIFDRFKRAHKVNVKGSGLGLAIVKRIIDLHEGTVEVQDGTDGKGTTFKVTLQKAKN
ncbi:ATP-binding protein [Methanolobus mangrovi]|uniref:histidine kinase n=1 Tax=Methanolobus mangrovi TaxID=3072977 RepID=A0AA51YHS6_9EURY|nr:ATP-binding protein [Methanolobus mangrovi]WMW23461.1 ATP-binding protein [Methanolobus mangrovi]